MDDISGMACCEKGKAMSKFKFALNDFVTLTMSAERGQVIGRAEYVDSSNCYLVRYLTGDGCQVENWIAEGALDIQPHEVASAA